MKLMPRKATPISSFDLLNHYVDNTNLSKTAFAVCMVLIRHYSYTEGFAFPRVETIAARVHSDIRSVRRALRQIEESGEWFVVLGGRDPDTGANQPSMYFPLVMEDKNGETRSPLHSRQVLEATRRKHASLRQRSYKQRSQKPEIAVVDDEPIPHLTADEQQTSARGEVAADKRGGHALALGVDAPSADETETQCVDAATYSGARIEDQQPEIAAVSAQIAADAHEPAHAVKEAQNGAQDAAAAQIEATEDPTADDTAKPTVTLVVEQIEGSGGGDTESADFEIPEYLIGELMQVPTPEIAAVSAQNAAAAHEPIDAVESAEAVAQRRAEQQEREEREAWVESIVGVPRSNNWKRYLTHAKEFSNWSPTVWVASVPAVAEQRLDGEAVRRLDSAAAYAKRLRAADARLAQLGFTEERLTAFVSAFEDYEQGEVTMQMLASVVHENGWSLRDLEDTTATLDTVHREILRIWIGPTMQLREWVRRQSGQEPWFYTDLCLHLDGRLPNLAAALGITNHTD